MILGLCGFLLLDAAKAGLFTGVVVLKDERRQGVGSLLLFRAIEEAKKIGAKIVEVDTIPGITAAIHLYPKFGGIESPAR